MKVTALIPDNLVDDVQNLSKGKNITDSIIIALKDWASNKKLKNLNKKVRSNPLMFSDGFSAKNTRKLNRKT